jgi:hypothetical protein
MAEKTRAVSIPIGSGGGPPWDGARLLASFFSTPAGARLVCGRAILELGAGVHGLPSFAAAVNGATCVVTDKACIVHPFLTGTLAEFKLHHGDVPLFAVPLEFGGNLKRALGRDWGPFDWVVLSEVLSLTPALFPSLLKTVCDAAPRNGVLVSFRAREGFEARFLEMLEGVGYRVQELIRGVHGRDGFICTEAGLEGCDVVAYAATRE